MRLFVICFSICSIAFPAAGREIVRCTGKGKSATIVFDAFRKNGMTFDCVEGDFIEDMTPCAPKGKFGLSYPTGSASIARVVSRWQDYGGHLGGVTSNATTKTRIGFLGGWMGPGGFAQQWSITIDRLTGSGVLSIQKDGTPQPENFDVECAVARPKL